MIEFDLFVEKVVLHNKLATSEYLQQAKDYLASHPEMELSELLVRAKVLSQGQVEKVREKYNLTVVGEQSAISEQSSVSQHGATVSAAQTAGSQPAAGAIEHLNGVAVEPPVSAPAASICADPATFTTIEQYLGYARQLGASDLHINAGAAPLIRKDGQLQPLLRQPFTAQESKDLLFSVLDGAQKEILTAQMALDTCCQVAGLGRYRSCFAHQSRGWDGSFRIVDQQVPSFEALQLPEQLKQLTEYNQGLVLLAGPGGCGKTTTMAAMIELINQQRDEHIITMEDPIEYVFTPVKSHISQRQVGAHTLSFSAALRAALREDPDIIMIGELRDRETATLAISAAETGHLVFASLHTTGAGQTISRILDFFPADQQGQIRSMISESIRGIICQRLIPRSDGDGRALALEILFNNTAISNLIREDRMFQLPTMMQINRDKGMCQLEDSLQQLVEAQVIDGVEAWFEATNKTPFKQFQPESESSATVEEIDNGKN
ncbi:MAG: hypothetical protein B6I36_00195 [Desulfobacteraceae bacterium 4572_35.1]|nr:MAG: hypothetical protein B6I36_00195 [Desulfobacteraceae bacterium 4572_35.1]